MHWHLLASRIAYILLSVSVSSIRVCTHMLGNLPYWWVFATPNMVPGEFSAWKIGLNWPEKPEWKGIHKQQPQRQSRGHHAKPHLYRERLGFTTMATPSLPSVEPPGAVCSWKNQATVIATTGAVPSSASSATPQGNVPWVLSFRLEGPFWSFLDEVGHRHIESWP